jgi:alpha-glucosidase
MRDIQKYLRGNNQKLVLNVSPASPHSDQNVYNDGHDHRVFMKNSSHKYYYGVSYGGLAAYPDWFHWGSHDSQWWWNKQFRTHFAPGGGVDTDAAWLDENAPLNLCDYPCVSPEEVSKNYPAPPTPLRKIPRELPGWPCTFQPEENLCRREVPEAPRTNGSHQSVSASEAELEEEQPFDEDAGVDLANFSIDEAEDNDGLPKPSLAQGQVDATVARIRLEFNPKEKKGFRHRNLVNPPYAINNVYGPLSQRTINTSLVHRNGLVMYDTHNLYATMTLKATYRAMLMRRPWERPFVMSRATFAGSGRYGGHWLGDNDSSWKHYRWSIRGMMLFNAIFQINMVGSDVCGYNKNTTEELCARWAMLGAFQPFYRNQNREKQADQEFYRWKLVTKAALKAIGIRYQLLDYFYNAHLKQAKDGTPAISPMFFQYPNDTNTYDLEMQYFWGPSLLVAPVTEENSTSVKVYFPKDLFYDFYTHEPIYGKGEFKTITNQGLLDIPLFLRAGTIVPVRVLPAMTTMELRDQDFEFIIPLNMNGEASGKLYLDHGDSVGLRYNRSIIKIKYSNDELSVKGTYGYQTKAKLARITVLSPTLFNLNRASNNTKKSTKLSLPLSSSFTVQL